MSDSAGHSPPLRGYERALYVRPRAERRHATRLWRFAGLAVGRRADLLSVARGAHDAGESRVAIPGADTAARGDQHALAIARERDFDVLAARRPLHGGIE